MDFKPIVLEEFINFDELQIQHEEVDEEKITENYEMTEQEIESLTFTLNQDEM